MDTALTFAFDVLENAVLTCGLAMVLVLIGLPVRSMLARLVPALPNTIGVDLLFGLCLSSVLSWYAFEGDVRMSWAYSAALALGTATLATHTWGVLAEPGRGRLAARHRAGLWRADVLSFLACVAVYLLLTVSKIKHGSLPWVTIGNNDLLGYLKMGGYLRQFPTDLQFAVTKDLHRFAHDETFGTFNLFSLGSFAMRLGVENFAVPVMAFAVGTVGMAIARCCRRVFRLDVPLSLLITLITLSCPLMSYVTLNYFLAQMLLVATLLTSTLLMVELSASAPLSFGTAAVLGGTSSIIVMMYYNPWLVQYVIIISGLMAVLARWRSRLPVLRWIAGLVTWALGGVTLIAALLTVLSFASVSATLARLPIISSINIAGWPLSFVDLDLLLGWPVDWRMHEDHVFVGGRSLAVVTLVILVFAMLLRHDRGSGRFARAVLVVTLSAAASAYLAVWFWFGPSYQQWKFATTIPLGYGFVISAAVVFLLLADASRTVRILVRSGAATTFALIIAANVGQFYGRWSIDVYDFPASLSSARMIDLTPGVDRGYIKIDTYLARMGASVFVRDKPVTFSGPTYWGDGSLPPVEYPFVKVEAACGGTPGAGVKYAAQEVDDGSLPVLPLGTRLSLSTNVDACIDLAGFGAPESFGRWTDGRHASIKFACGCDLAHDRIDLIVNAGSFVLPGRVQTQRALFRVNGAPDQEFDLTAALPQTLVIHLPLPRQSGRDVDVEIDLPDAVSPSVVSGTDTRVLALAVRDLELRKAAEINPPQ